MSHAMLGATTPPMPLTMNFGNFNSFDTNHDGVISRAEFTSKMGGIDGMQGVQGMQMVPSAAGSGTGSGAMTPRAGADWETKPRP